MIYQCIWILNALLFLVIIAMLSPFILIWRLFCMSDKTEIPPKQDKAMRECDQYNYDHEEKL